MPIISAPAEIPFTCLQGSPFQAVIQMFQNTAGTIAVDFTGYTFKMQIREGVADSGATVIKTLTSEGVGPGIVFIGANTDGTPNIEGSPDPTNGMIFIRMASAETALLKASKPPKIRSYPAVANLFYDIEATPSGGDPRRIAFGAFDVSLEVTRP